MQQEVTHRKIQEDIHENNIDNIMTNVKITDEDIKNLTNITCLDISGGKPPREKKNSCKENIYCTFCLICIVGLIILWVMNYNSRCNSIHDWTIESPAYIQCKKLADDDISAIVIKNPNMNAKMVKSITDKYMNFYGCYDMFHYPDF